METGTLYHGGYSPIYAGGTNVQVEVDIEPTNKSYVLIEKTTDLVTWEKIGRDIVDTSRGVGIFTVDPNTYIRLKLFGGIGNMGYTVNFTT